MMTIWKKITLLVLFVGIITIGFAFQQKAAKIRTIAPQNTTNNNPEELGKVDWLRDINMAVAQSKTQQKPILILFQEVPGCSTCRNYGKGALSHPLLVEAIETLFIPLAIHNNKGGEDAKVLKYFGEPSWNNPVVRIVDNTKKDLIPRVNGNYSVQGLVDAMIRALDVNNQVAPTYLELLNQELLADKTGTEEATFGMYCFWTGEKNLGQIEGVIGTKSGFMGGREVVKVEFDPSIVSYEKLVKDAAKVRCNSHTYTENNIQKAIAEKVVGKGKVSNKSAFRADREPKYYLGKTHYKYVPMTSLQAARANSLVGQGAVPNTVLSPRQIELASYIKKHSQKQWKEVIDVDFVQAWGGVVKVVYDD